MDGNAPLYIIDGVPFSSEKISTSVNAGGFLAGRMDPLNTLNPEHIESIEILKDADATAIYGSGRLSQWAASVDNLNYFLFVLFLKFGKIVRYVDY